MLGYSQQPSKKKAKKKRQHKRRNVDREQGQRESGVKPEDPIAAQASPSSASRPSAAPRTADEGQEALVLSIRTLQIDGEWEDEWEDDNRDWREGVCNARPYATIAGPQNLVVKPKPYIRPAQEAK